MATTNFTSGTIVESSWLNDVDAAVYGSTARSVFTFMTDAEITDVSARTASVDVTAAIASARAWLATSRGKLIFPNGIYKYSSSPNWAIHHSEVVFEGDCVLRYTGTGNAVIFDGTAVDAVGFLSTQVMQVKWGWNSLPAIEAPSTAQNGIFVKAVHQSKIGARVRGCGTTYSGLRVEYAVCTEFDVRVTGNQDGWYLSAKPENGIFLGAPASGTWAGVPTSYCTFIQPLAEVTNIGIYLSATLGNNFFGGTAEACSLYGVYAGVNSNQDKFYGTDFEVNTTADVYALGDSLLLSDCDSENIITFGTSARRCTVRGGLHSDILLDTSSTNCVATDLFFNRFNDGSTMQDAGTRNVVTDCRNLGTGEKYLTGSSVSAGVVGIADGTTSSITGIAVVGSKLGDFVHHSYSVSHTGLTRTAEVSSDGFVRAVFTNNSGGTVNLPAGTLYLEVTRR
jgi:hypothetical protein